MKIIDKRGRLFGKVNILDIAIFIVAVTALVSIYMFFVHRDKLKNLLQGEDEKWYITVEIITRADDFWLKKFIKEGDLEKGRAGEIYWQVKQIREISDDNLQKRLLVKVRMPVHRERRGRVYYGRYDIVPGADIKLDGSIYYLQGNIYSTGELEERIPY